MGTRSEGEQVKGAQPEEERVEAAEEERVRGERAARGGRRASGCAANKPSVRGRKASRRGRTGCEEQAAVELCGGAGCGGTLSVELRESAASLVEVCTAEGRAARRGARWRPRRRGARQELRRGAHGGGALSEGVGPT